jgi:protein-S-isoprenylcysteine O-methyltransferase Ste14
MQAKQTVPNGAASGERSRAYRFVEGAHLRQWLARPVAPIAALCTNGAGLLDVPWWLRHDALLAPLGLPVDASTAIRAAAVVLILAAVVLRVRSKGVLVRRTTLTTGGVYAHVRHPFYVAVMVGAVGTLTLAGSLGLAAALLWLLLAAPVYAITVAGEEDGLSTLFPDSWEAYAARVPRLLPRLRPARGLGGDGIGVTWSNLVAEHEPPRLLRFLGGALAVAGCASGGTLGWTLVGGAAVLFVASRVLPGIRPRSRRAQS